MPHAHVSTITLLLHLSFSSSLYIVYSIPSSHLRFYLTHRDAATSPLRTVEADPADLPEDMALRASVAAGRALSARLSTKRKLGQASQPLLANFSYAPEGAFFLTIPVGTPSQNMIFLIDTGSEFSWIQCSPCLNCTDTTAPRFAHNQSSSFAAIDYDSLLCRNSVGTTKIRAQVEKSSFCGFEVSYADGSIDAGMFSIDTFDLGPEFSQPFVFGCATIAQNTFTSSGLLGLDAGPFSFTSQLFSTSPGMPKKFAYCLPDTIDVPGRIEFGNYGRPMGMRYTPLAPPYSPLGSVYYYVELQGITVGESLIKVGEGTSSGGAPTIFDSGSSVTGLVQPLYEKVVGEMRRQTAHLGLINASASELGWDLCYKESAKAEQFPNVPTITLHFAGGVDLELGPGSVLLAVSMPGDHASIYFCFAFKSSAFVVQNVIGNYQQQNYWVEYNLDTSSLGLAKATCAH